MRRLLLVVLLRQTGPELSRKPRHSAPSAPAAALEARSVLGMDIDAALAQFTFVHPSDRGTIGQGTARHRAPQQLRRRAGTDKATRLVVAAAAGAVIAPLFV